MSDQEIQPVAEAAPGLSQMQRVTSIFTAPSKTFEDIKQGSKSWWMPFVIFVVVGYIFFAAVALKIGMQQVVENQVHLNPKQEEKMAEAPPAQREMAAKISLYVTEGVFIANPVIVLIAVAIGSLGLWGTINFVFGGKAKYGASSRFGCLPACPPSSRHYWGQLSSLRELRRSRSTSKTLLQPTSAHSSVRPTPTRRSTPWPRRWM